MNFILAILSYGLELFQIGAFDITVPKKITALGIIGILVLGACIIFLIVLAVKYLTRLNKNS
jgi:hypothetical protein